MVEIDSCDFELTQQIQLRAKIDRRFTVRPHGPQSHADSRRTVEDLLVLPYVNVDCIGALAVAEDLDVIAVTRHSGGVYAQSPGFRGYLARRLITSIGESSGGIVEREGGT